MALPIATVAIGTKTNIVGLDTVVNAYLSEEHSLKSKISTEPVESGAEATTNVVRGPVKIRLVGRRIGPGVALWLRLLVWQDQKQVLDVATKFGTYTNLVITSLRSFVDVNTGNNLQFEVELQELLELTAELGTQDNGQVTPVATVRHPVGLDDNTVNFRDQGLASSFVSRNDAFYTRLYNMSDEQVDRMEKAVINLDPRERQEILSGHDTDDPLFGIRWAAKPLGHYSDDPIGVGPQTAVVDAAGRVLGDLTGSRARVWRRYLSFYEQDFFADQVRQLVESGMPVAESYDTVRDRAENGDYGELNIPEYYYGDEPPLFLRSKIAIAQRYAERERDRVVTAGEN